MFGSPVVRSILATAFVVLPCGPANASPTVPLSIEFRTRAPAPGEPLRVDVRCTERLASLAGEFLGEPLHLVPVGRSGETELWSGWTMIGLDEKPGVASIEIHGESVSGQVAAGTLALTVEPKEFPKEELNVSSAYVEPPQEVLDRLAGEREKLARVYTARGDEISFSGPFMRPVPGQRTSIFGTRRIYNGQPRSPHPGLDLRAAEGTPVRASGAGRVVLSQDLYYSGNTVILDHGGGLFTLYAHLSSLSVAEERHVEAGDVLGLSGATGRVTGPHLHWGAKIGNRPFDPTALLDARLFD